MNWLVLFLFLTSSQLLLASDSHYLGTNRADIEAGLRAYTEKQLNDLRRKERFDGVRLAPPAPEAKEDEKVVSPASWEEEIAALIREETVKQKPQAESAPTAETSNKPSLRKSQRPAKVDWKRTEASSTYREKAAPPGELVTIPAGSYITADLLTGVDAPTQTSIPALIRTRYGFVSPNDGFVDLSGCHAVSQATGDLSTERVRIKTVSLACLSPERVPHEMNFMAFAVGEDGSFGIPGELRSRQGRVAMMAFLNGVVEGATKIVSETSSTVVSPVSALGNQSSSSAAAEVVRWYLEHAKALVPTVEVKAGVSIRLVLLETLKFPRKFFSSFQSTKENVHAESDLIY
ncbi:MAG: TraB/VirB10 family protein [Deltaproteobacteria bacterium]|nr:TraB/VirB10 family protein [Deltaproteobacteria bacterium]